MSRVVMAARDLMTAWLRRLGTAMPSRSSAAADPVEGRVDAGEYQRLYKYLHDRYASRVVLTFAEIEDLLGFSLPEPARRQPEWWSSPALTARRSAQSNSWTLASRTATVNLLAQSVVFESHTILSASPGRS